MEWALGENGWKLTNDSKTYNIKDIDKNEELYKDKIFFKER